MKAQQGRPTTKRPVQRPHLVTLSAPKSLKARPKPVDISGVRWDSSTAETRVRLMPQRAQILIGIVSLLASILGVVIVPAAPAAAAVTLVQAIDHGDNSGGQSMSKAFLSNNTAGNAIIAAFGFEGGASPTCGDSQANQYDMAVLDYYPAQNRTMGVCYARNIAAGANTVTVSIGGGNYGFKRLAIHEYSGLEPALGFVDIKASNNARSQSLADDVTSTQVATAYNGDLIFGATYTVSSSNITPGTGFTERTTSTPDDFVTEDKVQASAGLVDAKFSATSDEYYVTQMVAFRAANASQGPTPSGIQYVQTKSLSHLANGTTMSATLTNDVATGNTIVVNAGSDADAEFTCSDTYGNTYTNVGYTWSGLQVSSFGGCYAVGVTSGVGQNTVTVDFQGVSVGSRHITITEYSGISSTAPVDTTTSGNDGATTNPAGSAITTTSDGDLIYAAMVNTCCGGAHLTAGAGFTQRVRGLEGMVIVEDLVQPTAGAITADFNSNINVDYYAVTIAFRSANSAGVVVTTRIPAELTFGVSSHVGACNGVSQTGGLSVSGSTINFGALNPAANIVAAQDLHVVTNAVAGFTINLSSTGDPNDGNGHTIAGVSGTNTAPDVFPSAGTAAFGYTTDEATLGTGTVDRFTNPSAQWARADSTPSEVAYQSGPSDHTVCVAYQAGITANTAPGGYSTVVTYSVVPSF